MVSLEGLRATKAKGRGDGCLSSGHQAECKSTLPLPSVSAGPPGDWRGPPQGTGGGPLHGGRGGGPLLYFLTGSDENLFPNALTGTPQNHICPALWAPMVVKLVHPANRPALLHDHLPGASLSGVPLFFLLGLPSLVPRSPTIRQVTGFWPMEPGQKGCHHLQT